MAAMKKAADVLKVIHGNMTVDKVDATMAQVHEQAQVAQEIADIISNPIGMDQDDTELQQELEDLEQDVLNERLAGADHVPIHQPQTAVADSRHTTAELDEDAELRQLQAEMAL